MVTVLFDGNCIVCSTEILYYKSIGKDQLKIVDIYNKDFNAKEYKLDNIKVNKYMHVIVNNIVFTKIDAFVEIWKVLPGFKYKLLIAMSKTFAIRIMMDIG